VNHRCGTIAFVGRPNTGKSSLLNRLVGEKLSIVSPRPQTTRHLVTGILTRPGCQYIFVDAPGNPPRLKSVLHKALNRRVAEAASQSDVVLFVVEASRFGPEDHAALEQAVVDPAAGSQKYGESGSFGMLDGPPYARRDMRFIMMVRSPPSSHQKEKGIFSSFETQREKMR